MGGDDACQCTAPVEHIRPGATGSFNELCREPVVSPRMYSASVLHERKLIRALRKAAPRHTKLAKGMSHVPNNAPLAEGAADEVTERLVMGFLELIAERKAAGRLELAATMETIATWLSERTGLKLRAQHIQTLTTTLREAGLITVGGGGIGLPNTYDTCEKAMGPDAFWDQVDALLLVWRHPSRKSMV